MSQTTVLLVDDHTLIRQGCRYILEQHKDITVIGEASTGEDAVEKVKTLKPTVVIMDINLPGIGGIEVTRTLKYQFPRLHIVILSVHTDESYVYRALEAGASAYIVKQGGARELEEAVAAVVAGQVYLSASVSRPVVDGYMKHASRLPETPDTPLTVKEREVVQLLSRGFSSKEIAEQLKSSPLTVDVHRKNIMKKLALHSVPELVKWAIRHKLISVDE
ncbi:MAG: response regulator transcription factor [Deltaproteobacteria bacterium]|nr:response regulator transcription factor [Deltaproteobacteria bacterium]